MTGVQPAPVVHVVDDDEAFRTAMTRLLRAAGYEVRPYASAAEFLLSLPGREAGCLLLDLNLPGPSGLELQEALARREAPLPIVFLSGRGDIPASVRAMKAGAVDFLTKPVKREALLAAIRAALAGDERKRIDADKLKGLRGRHESLTARELEVFERVVVGKLNKVIAAELDIAERTVKAHRARVMEKMGAGTLAELVQIAGALRVKG